MWLRDPGLILELRPFLLSFCDSANNFAYSLNKHGAKQKVSLYLIATFFTSYFIIDWCNYLTALVRYSFIGSILAVYLLFF